MEKSKRKTYAIFIALTELVGGLSGFLTRKGTKVYQASVRQPPLSPPPAVFPIVWSILFALMGIGAARIWRAPPSAERTRGLRLFFTQLGFNFFWSIIFFNLQAFGFALLWLSALWVLMAMMISSFRKVYRLAALLQIPYLLWVSFAAYLNFGVWRLNR